jgi:hypothetical protein
MFCNCYLQVFSWLNVIKDTKGIIINNELLAAIAFL